MKKYLFFVLALFLIACNEDEEPSLSRDMALFMGNGGDFTEDTLIYMADSVSFAEELMQSVTFDGQWNKFPALTYKVNGKSSSINIRLEMAPSYDGGEVRVICNAKQASPILFEHPTFPAINYDGYRLDYKASIKLEDSTYHDILIFDASKANNGPCNFSKFYYSANDGIIKVISKQGISMNRITAEKYEGIMEKLAEERAVADSIEQAVADSIVQAIADSIVNASLPDSTDDGELEELIDGVTDCVKKVYSSGKISSLKDCEI